VPITSAAAITSHAPSRGQSPPSPSPSPDRIVPQTRRGLCDLDSLGELSRVDRLPLLVMSSEERSTLERHATNLVDRLLGPDGQAEMRALLAKRLATIDIEVQRLSAVQGIVLTGTSARWGVRCKINVTGPWPQYRCLFHDGASQQQYVIGR